MTTRLEAIENVLGRAFGLAYFIHEDRAVALEIVRRAASKLQVAAAAQGKRLYYRPTGRPRPGAYRSKVSFGEIHLLQRLLYIESEPFEIESERADSHAARPGPRAMLVRYIKHLLRLTTRRNSFYVTLGVARLLYNYSTAETMELYNTVIQDPERVKDDYYYRSRKGVLMQELKTRFGEALEVTRGPRGEERFRSREPENGEPEFVRRALEIFTPWETGCTLPRDFNPILDELPDLSFRGLREEDQTEVNRLHTVLHPACFCRLAEALKLPAPAERLEVPHFALSREQTRPPGDRRAPDLTPEELHAIQHSLSAQAARRRAVGAVRLRIFVDGAERARLDPRESDRARFDLAEGDELIEVRAGAGGAEEILLATHLLRRDEERTVTAASSIVLEGGQKITIAISERAGAAVAEVTYRASRGFAFASLFSPGRWRAAFGEEASPFGLAPALLLATGALVVCALLAATAVRHFFWREQSASPGELVARNGEETPPPLARVPSVAGEPPHRAVTEPSPLVTPAAPSPRASQTAPGKRPSRPPDEQTRALGGGGEPAELRRVKVLYLEITGDEMMSGDLRERLAERLRAGERFTLTQKREEADALLRVSLAPPAGGASGLFATARLIGPRGEMLWTGGGRRRFTSIESAVEALAGELLRAARQSPPPSPPAAP